jgi:hypothetical protein
MTITKTDWRQRPYETVLYQAELAQLDTTRGTLSHISGRAVPYGVWTNRGWFLESVAEGSLDKSIEEAASALPLHVFHDDTTWPIGISESWESKKDGLYGAWRLDDSEEAQRAARLARDGFMRWFSISISPIRSEWQYVDEREWDPAKGPDHVDRVTRVEARLLETSLVTTPAFATAQVKLVHSSEPIRAGRDVRPSLAAWQAWRAQLDEYGPGPKL